MSGARVSEIVVEKETTGKQECAGVKLCNSSSQIPKTIQNQYGCCGIRENQDVQAKNQCAEEFSMWFSPYICITVAVAFALPSMGLWKVELSVVRVSPSLFYLSHPRSSHEVGDFFHMFLQRLIHRLARHLCRAL
jgi:hypothetical protein